MPLILQTCMNEQPKTKHLHGDLIANAGHGTQNGTGAKRRAPRRKSAERNKLTATPDPRFRPARNLMIDLGWLRLFREIFSDRIPVARRPFAHEM